MEQLDNILIILDINCKILGIEGKMKFPEYKNRL